MTSPHTAGRAESTKPQPVKTKFGIIAQMWEMDDENARRRAIIRRASKGASRTLGTVKRDVIVIEPTPPPTPVFEMPAGAPAWKHILYETALKHRLRITEVISQQRSRPIVLARNEAAYRMKTETTMSLPAIGKRLGGRDHTTILHSIRRHKAMMEAGNAGGA